MTFVIHYNYRQNVQRGATARRLITWSDSRECWIHTRDVKDELYQTNGVDHYEKLPAHRQKNHQSQWWFQHRLQWILLNHSVSNRTRTGQRAGWFPYKPDFGRRWGEVWGRGEVDPLPIWSGQGWDGQVPWLQGGVRREGTRRFAGYPPTSRKPLVIRTTNTSENIALPGNSYYKESSAIIKCGVFHQIWEEEERNLPDSVLTTLKISQNLN